MRRLTLSILLSVSLVAAPALALDYRSLVEPTTMYDSPSQKGKPLFVIARYTPVEVVVALEGWVKVRDAGGGLAWVEKRTLGEKRTVLVTAQRAQVRNAPEANAPLVFEAEKDVVLDFVESLPGVGWAKVRHRDGPVGYVRANQVWGL